MGIVVDGPKQLEMPRTDRWVDAWILGQRLAQVDAGSERFAAFEQHATELNNGEPMEHFAAHRAHYDALHEIADGYTGARRMLFGINYFLNMEES